MKMLIGYAIKERLPKKEGEFRYPNLKVYKTEAMALRYARVKEVVPIYVEV